MKIWYVKYHKKGDASKTSSTMVKGMTRSAAINKFKKLYPSQTMTHIEIHSKLDE